MVLYLSSSEKLIDISDLKTVFPTDDGIVRAVDGVSFSISRGKTLGLVGESGCGKSVTGLSILQLVPSPGIIEDGSILWMPDSSRASINSDQPIDITNLPANSESMRRIRGNDIAMIFQEPMTSLNPVYTVGDQITEAIILHQNASKKEAREQAIQMIAKVGIPAPEQIVDEYPHQLSGGMRQRAMIAMALSCHPALLIADEPTTALDVTIQAQVLDLMRALQEEMGMAILLISHDLGVIAELADDVAVMYAGRIVEAGNVDSIFYNPLHPYTSGLLKSIPAWEQPVREDESQEQNTTTTSLPSTSPTENLTKKRLHSIPGTVPHPLALPQGCSFQPRCDKKMPKCGEMPELKEVEDGHAVRCWLVQQQTDYQYPLNSSGIITHSVYHSQIHR